MTFTCVVTEKDLAAAVPPHQGAGQVLFAALKAQGAPIIGEFELKIDPEWKIKTAYYEQKTGDRHFEFVKWPDAPAASSLIKRPSNVRR